MITLITTSIKSDFLLEAAKSVRDQTFTDFKWLLIFDGKKGVNEEVVAWIKSHIPQAEIVIQEHTGRVNSLINAHKLVDTPYIGWLDDDDLLHPDCLKECSSHISNVNQLVYTNHYRVNTKGEATTALKFGYSYQNLLNLFCAFHFRLFTKDLYQLVGGIDKRFKYSMDYELTLRMAKQTHVKHTDKFLYYYREHDTQVSRLHKEEQFIYHQRAFNLHKD